MDTIRDEETDLRKCEVKERKRRFDKKEERDMRRSMSIENAMMKMVSKH